MKEIATRNRIEAWMREELAGQERMQALLEREEAALLRADHEEIERVRKALEAEARSGVERSDRCARLLAAAATSLGAGTGTLTLKSLARRLEGRGIDATALLELRADLRASAARTLRAGRRIATVARYHRGLIEELAQVLLEGSGEDARGALVDARG